MKSLTFNQIESALSVQANAQAFISATPMPVSSDMLETISGGSRRPVGDRALLALGAGALILAGGIPGLFGAFVLGGVVGSSFPLTSADTSSLVRTRRGYRSAYRVKKSVDEASRSYSAN